MDGEMKPKCHDIIQGDGAMQTQKTFVVDTNCLLLSCNLTFDICHKNGFKIIIPQIVIDELDRLKDNKGHKENRMHIKQYKQSIAINVKSTRNA